MRKLFLIATPVALALLGLVLVLFVLTPRVRGDLVTFLAAQTGFQVEIGTLRTSVWPRVRIHGERLRVGGGEDPALPPLIAMDAFEVETTLWSLLARPRRLHLVRLQRLHVHIPPRTEDVADRRAEAASSPAAGSSVLISRVEAADARIEIASRDPDKRPRVYEIQRLDLGDVALDGPIVFDALVLNPLPAGVVQASGRFGPWNREEVRETPLSGTYVFMDADLGTLRGLGGRLTSTGVFGGTLDRLDVTGEAQIPDFSVDFSGQPVPLVTSFRAEVGGRTGDVQLQPVDVQFLDSRINVRGSIVRSVEESGRVIALDVIAQNSLVEDLLKFALAGETPPLTGNIELKALLEIPPGEERVLRRMRLEGAFAIAQATFTNLNVQRTLEQLSRIGGGTSHGERGSSVVSNLEGEFVLEDAVITFSRLTFGVPGMLVSLAGSYGLENEAMNFSGQVAFLRGVSELAPERARRVLRAVQPLVPGGDVRLVLPLAISGTRSSPSFGTDLRALVPDRPVLPDPRRLPDLLRRRP